MWDTRRSASVDKSEDVSLRKGLDWIVLYSVVCLLPSKKRSFWWLAPFTCTGRWYPVCGTHSFLCAIYIACFLCSCHCDFRLSAICQFNSSHALSHDVASESLVSCAVAIVIFVSDLSVKFVTCTGSRCCLCVSWPHAHLCLWQSHLTRWRWSNSGAKRQPPQLHHLNHLNYANHGWKPICGSLFLIT